MSDWIPREQPQDRIRQLPDLVDQISELGPTQMHDDGYYAPHFESKAPCNESVIFLLDDREDSVWGGLHRLQDVSRILWCAADVDVRLRHPQPQESTWRTECAWLADMWKDEAHLLPDVPYKAAAGQLHALYEALARFAGVHEPVSVGCPRCDGTLRAEGPVMVCDVVSSHIYPGAKATMKRWRTRGPETTTRLVEELPDLTANLLNVWKNRGKIVSVGKQGKANTWLPWDVICCLYPQVTEGLAT